MLHWRLSSAAGLMLAGRYEPVCSIVWGLPDCPPRRAFGRAMERAFEPNHCARIRAIWLTGNMLRGDFYKENAD